MSTLEADVLQSFFLWRRDAGIPKIGCKYFWLINKHVHEKKMYISTLARLIKGGKLVRSGAYIWITESHFSEMLEVSEER
jgi:hypothetical protein